MTTILTTTIKARYILNTTKEMTNIAIFVSGSGTNCENIIRYFQGSATVATPLVVSNRADAGALERARRLNVPATVITKKQFANQIVSFLII